MYCDLRPYFNTGWGQCHCSPLLKYLYLRLLFSLLKTMLKNDLIDYILKNSLRALLKALLRVIPLRYTLEVYRVLHFINSVKRKFL